jgi:hypothetical protein
MMSVFVAQVGSSASCQLADLLTQINNLRYKFATKSEGLQFPEALQQHGLNMG